MIGNVNIRGNAEDIIEIAKRDREERKLRREAQAFALKLQSWWRGRHCYKKYLRGIRLGTTTTDNKEFFDIHLSLLHIFVYITNILFTNQ
jgi:hypothetical protein